MKFSSNRRFFQLLFPNLKRRIALFFSALKKQATTLSINKLLTIGTTKFHKRLLIFVFSMLKLKRKK